jgi:hypothetical protein
VTSEASRIACIVVIERTTLTYGSCRD